MKKPTEPEKPWPPYPAMFAPQDSVRVKIGPGAWPEDWNECVPPTEVDLEKDWDDEPCYPAITADLIRKLCEEHKVESGTAYIEMHPRAYTLDMVFCGHRIITEEDRKEAEVKFQKAQVKYERKLAAYEEAMKTYEQRLRLYYLAKADKVGK